MILLYFVVFFIFFKLWYVWFCYIVYFIGFIYSNFLEYCCCRLHTCQHILETSRSIHSKWFLNFWKAQADMMNVYEDCVARESNLRCEISCSVWLIPCFKQIEVNCVYVWILISFIIVFINNFLVYFYLIIYCIIVHYNDILKFSLTFLPYSSTWFIFPFEYFTFEYQYHFFSHKFNLDLSTQKCKKCIIFFVFFLHFICISWLHL